MEKMREQFEVEYIKSLNSNYFSFEDEKLSYIKKDDDGNYLHDATYKAFHWWKASRSVLCVELPDNCKGMAITVKEFHEQLDKVGVSYE